MQTQSPLDILSFEDMLFVALRSFEVLQQTASAKTGDVSFPDPYTPGRLQNKIQNGARGTTMRYRRYHGFTLSTAFLFHDLSYKGNRDPRILYQGWLLIILYC